MAYYNPLDAVRLAARNVFRGGVKSFLCALAVCVGICSVCSVSGVGRAIEHAINDEIDSIGIGGVIVYPAQNAAVIDPAQAAALETIDGVRAATPLSISFGSASVAHARISAVICGVGRSLDSVLNATLLHGRLPSGYDVDTASRVCVVDEPTALSAYRRVNIVGKQIHLSFDGVSESFTVIGVIKAQKQGIDSLVGQGTLPTFVYVPFTTVNELFSINKVDKIAISCFSGIDQDECANLAVKRLSALNDNQAFKYENIGGYMDSFKSIIGLVSVLIVVVASISILVGGLGVMNAMVASVEKRTREIGVYMALGASRGLVLSNFIIESILICLAGGGVGGLLSIGALSIFESLLGLPASDFLPNVAYGVLSAVACGVVFGALPAYRASKLNPIDAIRLE